MGYIRDHAIIVVGRYGDWVEKAHSMADTIFPWVSPPSPEGVNGSRSFFVPPDGSKEGWPESDVGDGQRNTFIRWLEAQAYEDGSSPLSWIEVRVSDDNGELCIERSNESVRAEQLQEGDG